MADKLTIARTTGEAARAGNKDNTYLAGGTELLHLGSELARDSYISIRRLEGLRFVRKSQDAIEIGAACTFQELIENPDIPAYLKEALGFMASRTRRNMATIGGNVAACRDDSFLVPTLLAASAELTLLDNNENKEEISLEEYISGKSDYSAHLIISIKLPAEGVEVRSARSANTAQSHARLTAALGRKDERYSAYAAIKNYGLVKFGVITDKMSSPGSLSEEEIVDYIKNDEKIALTDDLLYGSADYRKYLLGIFFADMYADITG